MDQTNEQIQITLTSEPLDVQACYEFVQNNGAGGNTLFVGTVRDQTGGKPVVQLEFEAYKGMAVKEMNQIALDIVARWNAIKVCIHHRTGTLQLGDIAVIIGVSCPHRDKAFTACQYAIDTLKETVPIWKKEVFEDGAHWVSAHP